MPNQAAIFPLLTFVAVSVIALADVAFAAPGGRIAEAMFESFWGRITLFLLVITLAPLIAYVYIREWLTVRKASQDLRYMAQHSPHFEAMRIDQRAKDCIHRIYAAWSKEDVGEASDWMTNWYWQNQQLVHINRWEREGLVNVCNLKSIQRIRPLLLVHRNDGTEHEGSILVLQVRVKLQDYLADRDTGKVVEGSKKAKEMESNWTMFLENGRWVVSDISKGHVLPYARIAKELPPIEATLLKPYDAAVDQDAGSPK